MKNFTSSLFLLGILFSLMARTEGDSKTSHLPHNHSSHAGGRVLMSGDDHLEAKLDKKQNLIFFMSDKFRKALSDKDCETIVYTQKNEVATPLAHKTSPRAPYERKVKLPKGFSHDEVIYVKVMRKNPPKVYIAGSSPLKFTLMELHAGH